MKYSLYFLQFVFVYLIFCTFITNAAEDNNGVDENRDDNGDPNDEANSMVIPVENEPNNVTCTRRQNSQIHEIRSAQHKQFPFLVAVMSDNNEYICSGTVVSNGLVLTTAKCTLKGIKYVLLNTTKAKQDETTAVLRIIKTEKFPTYTTGATDKDVGLIYTEKHNNTIGAKIKLSNYTSTRNIVDIEVLGFGLNSEVGQTKELQYIGLQNRDDPTLSVSLDSRDLIQGYFDCIDTKVITCFKDFGGPAIFANELVGIVVKGQDDCINEMTSMYGTNKKVVDVLPTYTFKSWLDVKIKKNEEKEQVPLVTYPNKPTRRELVHKMKNAACGLSCSFINFMGFIMLLMVSILH